VTLKFIAAGGGEVGLPLSFLGCVWFVWLWV
jgi:hypothetical protein